MGDEPIKETPDFKVLEKSATQVIRKAHKFDRLTLTKDEALELFGVRPLPPPHHHQSGCHTRSRLAVAAPCCAGHRRTRSRCS